MASRGHDPIPIFSSYSTMTTTHDDDDDEEEDHHLHPHSLSRLSMVSSPYDNNDSLNGDDDSNDGEADEEFSDEPAGGLSLPATPTRRITLPVTIPSAAAKECVSENEGENSRMRRGSSRRRSFVRDRWLERCNLEEKKEVVVVDEEEQTRISGESECLVMARPKGGRRSLCMDLEEVRACRDLGFELEHDKTHMLEIPSRLSISCCSAIEDTSSGGNSPISNWRISSPGDDPKEVKARLKVWAQAVALASASSY